jgi:hypothetical protein
MGPVIFPLPPSPDKLSDHQTASKSENGAKHENFETLGIAKVQP